MKITIDLTSFCSPGDEQRFFRGLNENPAVSAIQGIGRKLELTIVLKRLNRDSLHDLIALLWRYGIPLSPLAGLSEKPAFLWLNDERSYWHQSMYSQGQV